MRRSLERYPTRTQQEEKAGLRKLAAVGLEAKLRLLLDDALIGDVEALTEFQQMVQYAPRELKAKLLGRIKL